VSYDPNNVFAQILDGSLSSEQVFEDGRTLVIMDIMPATEGHVLIIPKTRAENIYHMDNEFLSAVGATTKKIATAIKEALNPSGVIIKQFNGSDAGQTVFHYHVHIIPVYPNERIGEHGANIADPEQLARVAALIKASINNDN
jgi:histidine triad (HIT) family protein